MRKRVWWTLYSFELMQVSSHDRPSAIDDGLCSVGCPKASILGAGLPPDYMSCSNRLIVILSSACRAMRTIRTAPPGLPLGGQIPTSASLLKDLDSWESSLPSHLSLESIHVLPPSYQRPLLLLHLQYHYVITVVSRSALLSLVVSLSRNPKETLPEATISMSTRCIASGRKSCDLVQKLDAINQFSAVTWWDIYYAYSSALILVLNTICDVLSGESSTIPGQAREYLNKCSLLAMKHLRNSMMPATIRRWATTITELDVMAADFVEECSSQGPGSKVGQALTCAPPASQLTSIPTNEPLNEASIAPVPNIPAPGSMPTPQSTGGIAARNSFMPWSQLQFLDEDINPFLNELQWDGIEDMLLGDQRTSWEA